MKWLEKQTEEEASVPEPAPTGSSLTEANKEGAKAPETTRWNTALPVSGVNAHFQEAMDSYEAFLDQYIQFMNFYDASDAGMMTEYAIFLVQSIDMMEKLDAIDKNQLSVADEAYYLEVMSRIYVKLEQAALPD